MKRTTNPTVTAALAAGLVCLLVYLRALGCDFVNYDDPAYVAAMTEARSGQL